ncbi:unnamed protein product [Amaranthus hypochondriacus]
MSIVLVFSILILLCPTKGALQKGFTTHLIHRDSPSSPLYNPFLNKWDRVREALHRSIYRTNRLISPLSSRLYPSDIQAKVISASGEYVMEVFVGTPPVKQFGIVDTGSDLIWTQCQPCIECFKQEIPIFNPRKSSSYKIQSCESKACHALDRKQAGCTKRQTCTYAYNYGDQSHTIGDVALETLYFNSINQKDTTSYPNIVFGCGHDNAGTFNEHGSGLVGLGGGPLSLVSQLKSTIGGKFSHCLIPFSNEDTNLTSKINFGSNAEVTGHGVVSTPLVSQSSTYYFLTLEAISVKTHKIPFSNYPKSSIFNNDYGTNEGNIIIDSGTTLTILPPDFYNDLTNVLENTVKGSKVDDPTGTLDLCYKATEDIEFPDIIAHFKGANVELKPVNTFIKVAEDVICLAAMAAEDMAIFGNVAQANFLVGYDTQQGTVSFKPLDCTNF